MSLEDKLERVLRRHEELASLLGAPDAGGADDFARLSKEYADLMAVVEAITQWRDALHELADLQGLIDDPDSDGDMRAMAEAEYRDVKQKLPDLERDIQVKLLPKDAADEKNAILEVRAGTGGEEAALFAADLFRMYQRYADTRGWKFEVMSVNETGIGGYKEAVASISGKGVFARLKYESWIMNAHCASTCIGSSGFRPRNPADAFIPRRRPWRSCRRRKRWMSRSRTRTCVSTRSALKVRAASTSIRPTAPCASPTFPLGSWCRSKTKNLSIRIKPRA